MKHFFTGFMVSIFLAAVFAQDNPPGTIPVGQTWTQDTWDSLYAYLDSDAAAKAEFNTLVEEQDVTGGAIGKVTGFKDVIGSNGWVELFRNAYDGSYILEAWASATSGESAYIKVWYEWLPNDVITAYVLEHSKRGTNVFSQLVFGYEGSFPRSVIATSTLTFLSMKVVVTEAGSSDSAVIDTSNTGRIITFAYTNIYNLAIPTGNFPTS